MPTSALVHVRERDRACAKSYAEKGGALPARHSLHVWRGCARDSARRIRSVLDLKSSPSPRKWGFFKIHASATSQRAKASTVATLAPPMRDETRNAACATNAHRAMGPNRESFALCRAVSSAPSSSTHPLSAIALFRSPELSRYPPCTTVGGAFPASFDPLFRLIFVRRCVVFSDALGEGGRRWARGLGGRGIQTRVSCAPCLGGKREGVLFFGGGITRRGGAWVTRCWRRRRLRARRARGSSPR